MNSHTYFSFVCRLFKLSALSNKKYIAIMGDINGGKY